jgi:AcrR family transcriptional regulator
MGMAEGRLSRKQQQARTRSSLMRSAARVFARRGLRQATIDEVAADAGFTKGAFYANFSSKEELFLAMLDEGFATRLRQVEELSASDSEIERRARVAGADFARYMGATADWQRLFFEFVAHAARNELFRRELVWRYRDLRTGIAEIFAQRSAELEMTSPVDVNQLAMMTFAMANGFALEQMIDPEAASDELYGTLLGIFFAGLRTLAQQQEQGGVTLAQEQKREQGGAM